MRKLLFIVLLVVTLTSISLVACSEETETTAPATTTTAPTSTTKTTAATSTVPATTSPDAEKYGGIFKRAQASSPSRPIGYPAEAANDSYLWAAPVLDRLVMVSKQGEIVPELAVSWKPGDDGKSIIIGLRKGVKFHDGSDFNAEVCKWNLDMQIEAKKNSDWTSIDIIDDYTIRINVAQYKNNLLNNLASGYTQMISKKTFDEKGVEWCRWHPVGTGPFIFESYERDAKIVYTRNPNYWDEGKPYLDGMIINVIADTTVQKLAFQKGELHRLSATGINAQELRTAGYTEVNEPAGTYALVPDSEDSTSPWSKLDVRLAASYAIDRQAIADALGYGLNVPAYQLYPGFKQTAIPNLDIHKYSPEKAKALLKEAGYPNGFKVSIHPTTIIRDDYTTALIGMFDEVGIKGELDKLTYSKFTELRYGGWDGLMNMAFNNFTNFVSMSDYFLALQFPDVKIPAGLEQGFEAAAVTPEVEPALIQAVIRVMYDDVMVIPYIEERRATFLQKGVHDPGTSVFSLTTYYDKDVWLEPSAR